MPQADVSISLALQSACYSRAWQTSLFLSVSLKKYPIPFLAAPCSLPAHWQWLPSIKIFIKIYFNMPLDSSNERSWHFEINLIKSVVFFQVLSSLLFTSQSWLLVLYATFILHFSLSLFLYSCLSVLLMFVVEDGRQQQLPFAPQPSSTQGLQAGCDLPCHSMVIRYIHQEGCHLCHIAPIRAF